MLPDIKYQLTCPAKNGKIIQKDVSVMEIFQNEAISCSCNLRETRVVCPGIAVAHGHIQNRYMHGHTQPYDRKYTNLITHKNK